MAKGDARSAQAIAYAGAKELVTRSDARQGFFLSEAELAAKCGVSRTPVRGALSALEAERLLQIVPNRGAYVPPMSDREFVEVMDARILIEVFCARRAARSAAFAASDLESLLTEQELLLDDPEAFIDCDRRFHSTIVAGAGHSIFIGVYDSLRDRQLRMGLGALLAQRERAERVLREHRAIADALAACDDDQISDTIEQHILQTLDALQVSWSGR